jgi:hypothetical protein
MVVGGPGLSRSRQAQNGSARSAEIEPRLHRVRRNGKPVVVGIDRTVTEYSSGDTTTEAKSAADP